MWLLRTSEIGPDVPLVEVGKFSTLTAAVERILKLEEASPDFSLFLDSVVNPSQERSDFDIMSHFRYIGKKAIYRVEWILK